ncbi:MAG TPA: TonB-dependent receptor [Ignavibacteria bacterium]|nr:TonB-dependent receptor [Ignavibacteria bacterium]
MNQFFRGFFLKTAFIIAAFVVTGSVTSPLKAQETGVISGSVIDKTTGLPVEGADITVNRVKDSSFVKGTQTNAAGQFTLSGVPYGKFYLKANLVGYNLSVVSGVTINPNNLTVALEPIKLSSGNTTTDEIVVESEKSQIEFRPDKKVFNVGKNITNQGSSVIDLLKEIPSVTVDQDNNISLRGSEGVKIMIDGRPSGLEGTNRGDLLAQISATQVESIELITNPSAKYEAEGSSGIINIIMKKNENRGVGYNGTIGLNIGTRDKYSGQFSFSLKNSKYNMYGNYGYNSNHMIFNGLNERFNYINSDSYFTDETSNARGHMRGHNAKFGVDFFLNPSNTLGFSFNLRGTKRSRFDNTDDLVYNNSNILTSQYFNITTHEDDGFNYDIAANYTLRFKKPQQVFTADLSFSRDKDDEVTNTYDTYITPIVPEPVNRNEFSKETDDAYIAELNYVHPFSKDAKIETGFRGSYKKRDNDYRLENYDYQNNQYVTSLNSSNRFIYKEQINAFYGIYTNQLGNFGFSLGTRIEQTIVKGELMNNGQTFDRIYVDFFPSASISQKLTKTSEIQLSYARRVNRPRSRQLNPFVTISMMGGTNTLSQGNPDLNPEFTDAFELSYIQYLPFATVTPTFFYRQTKDQISRSRTLVDSITTLSTFVNYNKSKFYGGELILNATPSKTWTLNGTLSYYKTEIDASNLGTGISNSGYSWTARAMSTLVLPFDMSLQVSYFYSGKHYNAQGTFEPFSMLDAALKKDFFNKRLSMTLRVSDILDEAKFKANISGEGYYETFERKRDARTVFLNISYRFGQQDKNKFEKGKKRNNDDNNNNGDDGMDY